MTTERPVSSHLERQLFTPALLLATWIPMAFFIAVGSLGGQPTTGGLDTVRTGLLFVGGIHVAATLLLYVDRKFLPLVLENKVRYVYLPIGLIVASGAIFMVGGPVVQLGSYLILWAWQTHHYGRQNVGVYSFASVAGGWRPHRWERRALDLAALCGICGTFKVLGTDLAPRSLHGVFDLTYQVGALAYIGVLGFSVYVYAKHRHDFTVSRTVLFFTLVLFFVPMFLSSNIDVAFFSYAIAHGVQYLAFMTVLSVDLGTREGRRGVSPAMVGVGALLIGLGLVGARAADLKAVDLIGTHALLATPIDFLAGIGLGTTIAHFVIDAGAWRLSRPTVRRYVTERFAFLFERVPAAPARDVVSGDVASSVSAR